MPNIKPVSDLRNYGKILDEVSVNEPVLLTKNGYGRYVVLDIQEYDYYQKLLARERLYSELEKGRRSGEEDGWMAVDEAFALLKERHNANR